MSEPPRICVLASAPFARGGMERLTWDIHSALRSALGEQAVAMAALVGANEGTTPGAGSLAYVGGYPLTLVSKLRFTAWVVGASRRWGPLTSLLSINANQSQVAALASRLSGARFGVWAHGDEVWGRMNPISRGALRRADLVLCSSDFTRRQVVEFQGVATERAVTVYPPVNRACMERAKHLRRYPNETAPVILSVGRVARGYEYKGFDTVIQALPSIRERVPEVRYLVMGDGDGLPRLRRIAAACGVADHVEFRGAVPDEALWAAFEEARVFAMPSRGHTGASAAGEGFGIVYAEAAAFGRPVVGSTMGGAAEAVVSGTTGLTVDPTEPEAIARALLDYLEDPARADRDGAAGRARALEQFTPDRFAANLMARLGEAGVLPPQSGADE